MKKFKLSVSAILLAAVVISVSVPIGSSKSVPAASLPLSAVTAVSAEVTSREEAIYTVLNADGSVSGTYAVISLSLSGSGSFSDYGEFGSLKNLTTTEELSANDGSVSAVAPGSAFVYQGSEPAAGAGFSDFSISYSLDGNPVSLPDAYGKSGVLSSEIAISPRGGSEYFAGHYVLQVTITLPGAMFSNVTAEGASVVSVGGTKRITFTVLNGGGILRWSASGTNIGHFTIEIAGVPMDLSSMVSSALPDLSDMMAQLDSLTSAVDMLSKSAVSLDNNIKSLNEAAGMDPGISPEIAEGLAALKGGSMQLRIGLELLNQGVAVIPDEVSGLLSSFGGSEPAQPKSFISDKNDAITQSVAFVWRVVNPEVQKETPPENTQEEMTLIDRITALFGR